MKPLESKEVMASLDTEWMTQLAQLVRQLNSQGHNPATSGNYSIRSSAMDSVAYISESGIDKSLFRENHFISVNIFSGEKVLEDKGSSRKVSDEGPLHRAIYRALSAHCVLHSHFLDSLLFADLFPGQEVISVEGLELLKGFKGVKSHQETVKFLCFENTQDMDWLADEVEKKLKNENYRALLLRGHGIYVWGESPKDAKRHLEVVEYLFNYFLKRSR